MDGRSGERIEERQGQVLFSKKLAIRTRNRNISYPKARTVENVTVLSTVADDALPIWKKKEQNKTELMQSHETISKMLVLMTSEGFQTDGGKSYEPACASLSSSAGANSTGENRLSCDKPSKGKSCATPALAHSSQQTLPNRRSQLLTFPECKRKLLCYPS